MHTIRKYNYDPNDKWLELWIDGIEYEEETIWSEETNSLLKTGNNKWNYCCKRGAFETNYFKFFGDSCDYDSIIGMKVNISNNEIVFIREKPKTYLVGYNHQQYDFKWIFSTDDELKAVEWCVKFDRILREYKSFLSQFEKEDVDGSKWFKDDDEELLDKWYTRWSDIRYIEGSAKYEIEKR